jgi:opacity protein-like surface antigen
VRRLAFILVFLAPAAYAQDELWRGFYGGIGAGGGNAHSTWVTDATFGTLDETVDHKARGALGGLQFGYRKPVAGPLLLGMEVAWYAGKMEERSDSNTGAPNRERITKVRNPGSLAGLVGLAGSRSLFYLRGGVAFAQIELQAINHQIGNVATWESTGVGWTAGTGFETHIHRRLSLGLEYNHARMTTKDQDTINSGGVQVHAADFKTKVNLLLLRLNYNY